MCFIEVNELSPSGNMDLPSIEVPSSLQWSSNGPPMVANGPSNPYRDLKGLNVAPGQKITRFRSGPKYQSRPIEEQPPLPKTQRDYN